MARTLEDGALEVYDDEEMGVQDDAPLASPEGGEESPRRAPSVPAEAPEEKEAAPEAEEGEEPSDRDLTRNADFRRYQSARDREIARLRRELEEQRQAQAAVEEQRLQSELETLLAKAEEADDPTERRTLLQQAAQRQAYLLHLQYRRWESWKRSRLREAGLDPDDPRFDRDYRSADEFERDVLKAELEKLRKQVQEAGRTGKPAPAGAPGRRSFVDTGEPSGGGFDLESDMAAFNAGRLSREEFVRRWGKKR